MLHASIYTHPQEGRQRREVDDSRQNGTWNKISQYLRQYRTKQEHKVEECNGDTQVNQYSTGSIGMQRPAGEIYF